jgi:S1-C subfamily serine protease
MPNDTPDNAAQDTPEDSHVPFISKRNEDDGASVSHDMSTTEDSTQKSEDSDQQSAIGEQRAEEGNPQSANREPPAEAEDSIPQSADSEQPGEDSDPQTAIGEQPEEETAEILAESGELTADSGSTADSASDSVPVQTVAFNYDDYYGVPETPPRPVPVSDRIVRSEPTEKKRSNAPYFLGALAAGVVGAALTVGILAGTGAFDTTETATTTVAVNASEAAVTVPIPAATTQIINDLGSAINPAAVAAKVVPSIVTVTVFEDGSDTENALEGEDGLFGVGSGSGVVISRDGYIITNHHVIDGATDYRVEFEDGRVYTAELVGSDELTDIAVLQISANNLVPIDLGSSDALDLGDPAIAVGNPLGQDGGASVSVGIVSAFDRRVDFSASDFLHGMIQTDAAINSGSSGGALVNADGALIGITSAIGVSQAGPEGIGYAIPVELVKRISDEIIDDGDVQHPFLGVTIGTFFDEAPDGATIPAGADIQTIEGTDSAAGQAGLLPGDVIIRIGDKPIIDQTDLILAVRLYRVGDEVEFEAIRDGEAETFTVVFGQRPTEFGG